LKCFHKAQTQFFEVDFEQSSYFVAVRKTAAWKRSSRLTLDRHQSSSPASAWSSMASSGSFKLASHFSEEFAAALPVFRAFMVTLFYL
jgi:predicted AAA+ superfamily ATPase